MTDIITIKGKDYPVRISHKAIKAWRIKTNRKIETLGQEPGDMELLLLEGLRVGAKLEKQTCTIDIEDIDDWLDEDMVGNMEKITEALSRSFPDMGGKPSGEKNP